MLQLNRIETLVALCFLITWGPEWLAENQTNKKYLKGKNPKPEASKSLSWDLSLLSTYPTQVLGLGINSPKEDRINSNIDLFW